MRVRALKVPDRWRARQRAEARRFGRSAGMLSLGIGSAGVLTYLYFSLASHNLDRTQYGEVVVLWSAVFVLDLGPVSAHRAAALADDRRAPGARPADRLAAAGRRDDPARPGRRLRGRGVGAPRPDPGRPLVRQRDALLDPRHRGPRLRRQLLRAGLPRGQPALRALRGSAVDGVDRPDVVRPGGRAGDHERADRGGTRDHRRARPQPHRGPARVRGQRDARRSCAEAPPKPASRDPSSPWRTAVASRRRCS